MSNELILQLKKTIQLPLIVETISPDIFSEHKVDEIESLPVFYGNRRASIKDFFSIKGSPSDQLVIEGDLSKASGIGTMMTRGKIVVKGNCGNFTGAFMKGGQLLIEGNAGDWLGAEMKGGLIKVKGNTGNFTGGAIPGEKFGMIGGTIMVGKNVGKETGLRMLRGVIAIGGRGGDFLGSGMKGGTIIVASEVGKFPGFNMKGGTIIIFRKTRKPSKILLPTFEYNCSYNPVFLKVLLKDLHERGFETDPFFWNGNYHRFLNSLSLNGRGEILLFEHFF